MYTRTIKSFFIAVSIGEKLKTGPRLSLLLLLNRGGKDWILKAIGVPNVGFTVYTYIITFHS